MTIKELQNLGYKQLQHTVFHPDLESDSLLMQVLKKERSFLYAHPKKKATNSQIARFKKIIERRRKGEPFAYLTGQVEFYDHQFKVTPDVLIPRPETELLVDEALSLLRDARYAFRVVVDIGTGSGAIIISIAKTIEKQSKRKEKKLKIFGTDISAKALKIARVNARKILSDLKQIRFLKGDLLAPIPQIARSRNGGYLIIANLPYLTPQETRKKELMFEPKIALMGGKVGLEPIAKLIKQFGQIAKRGDFLLLEIGAKQSPQIKQLTKKYLPQAKLKIKKDYSGFDRVVIIKA